MKKLTTYYFLLLAILSALFAQCLMFAIADCKVAMDDILEGKEWHPWTERAFHCPWWLWIGVAICVAGTALSLLGRPKDYVLRTLLVVFLIVELLILFVTLVAFHLPFVTLLN